MFQNWKNVSLNGKLHLPARNEFIPTNFDLVTREEELEDPQVLHCSDLTRLWYKQDNKFLLPKACIGIDITRYLPLHSCVDLKYTFMCNKLLKILCFGHTV